MNIYIIIFIFLYTILLSDCGLIPGGDFEQATIGTTGLYGTYWHYNWPPSWSGNGGCIVIEYVDTQWVHTSNANPTHGSGTYFVALQGVSNYLQNTFTAPANAYFKVSFDWERRLGTDAGDGGLHSNKYPHVKVFCNGNGATSAIINDIPPTTWTTKTSSRNCQTTSLGSATIKFEIAASAVCTGDCTSYFDNVEANDFLCFDGYAQSGGTGLSAVCTICPGITITTTIIITTSKIIIIFNIFIIINNNRG